MLGDQLQPRLGLLATTLAIAALLLLPVGASAEQPRFWKSCESQTGEGRPTSEAGQCSIPRGIGVDPETPGHLFIADQANDRIVELSAWGQFQKAWGWGVIDGSEELQVCTAETGCQEARRGAGTGQLSGPQGVAVDSAGAVHVVDLGNRRIQKFSPEGSFLAAYGGDTVAHGPSDSSNDETQELSIAAGEGTFKLSFANPFREGGIAQTTALPYNASAAELEAALNDLATIGGIGGSVSVSGGPGDATGSAPYRISFEANLGGDDVPRLELDRSELGPASIGATLRCESTASAPTLELSWLRNGVPISGEASDSYTTTAADEGKAIQCRVRTEVAGGGGAMQAASPVYVAPPAPAAPPVPDLPQIGRLGIGENLGVGGSGGAELRCIRGNWQNAFSFAYRWYRNGIQIAGAEASTYVVTAEDLVTPAVFQCEVIGSNAAGIAAAKLSINGLTGPPTGGPGVTNPPPANPVSELNPRVSMQPPSNVHTPNQGGAAEACTAADVCKVGVEDERPGFFGAWPASSFIAIDTKGTEAAADDIVYVGDVDRIQELDAAGAHLGEIALPEAGKVGSLAVDPVSGDLYFHNSHKAGPSGVEKFKVFRLDAASGAPLWETEVDRPRALTTDTDGNLYVVDGLYRGNCCVDPDAHPARVLKFNAGGKQTEKFGEDDISFSTGIATGSACLSEGVGAYLANSEHSDSFVRAFGPPPDDNECPPEGRAPSIESSYATSVGTEEAQVEARINPHYWSGTQGTTTYLAQYATAACIEVEGWGGACVEENPGSILKAGVVNEAVAAPVSLTGLAPSTEYRFRFAAESEDSEDNATVEGQPVFGGERAFRTFPTPESPDPCPNDAFRTGPSASLPDCRAYELVSPVDKEGGELLVQYNLNGELTRLDQAAVSGDRIAYSAYRAFAQPEGAPYSSQYIATRGAGGWSSENVSPPREGPEFVFLGGLDTPYRFFSPELGDGWLLSFTEPPLAAGAQPGFFNLYRRQGTSGSYETCTSAEPRGVDPSFYLPVLQGVSADRRLAVLRANAALSGGASEAEGSFGARVWQLYACVESEGGPRQLQLASVLPSGAASQRHSSAGTPNGGDGPGRKATLAAALSEDGSRLYWTTSAAEAGAGALYLRENPAEPQSELAHGGAVGTGDLIGPASGTATVLKERTTIFNVALDPGSDPFSVGQQITDSGGAIPPGTTITAIAEPSEGRFNLTLSAETTATAIGDELSGLPSAVVFGAVAERGAFAPGQQIEGAGIPPETRIEAVEEVEPGLFELTLSEPATETGSELALESFSECIEPERACTLRIPGGRFWGAAAADGGRMIFSGAGSLRAYEAETETTEEIAPGFAGVAGISEDASRVYFASTAELAAKANVLPALGGEEGGPVEGERNLYLYDAGAESLAFVATLADEDATAGLSPLSARPYFHSARATPDGGHLAFTSAAQPTGYDNTDAVSGRAAAEVYLYDAGTRELVCASCNPSGSRPRGRAERVDPTEDGIWAAAHIAGWMTSLHATRALSADGNRVFFDSSDSLSLSDTNGKVDVYQWEAPGAGDCGEDRPTYSLANGGCIELISSGKHDQGSEFIDADPSGANVFFVTGESLLAADPGLLDLYVARAGGGFPDPASPRIPCEGEGCQSPPPAPPTPAPASRLSQGAGNAPSPSAGRCRRAARKAKGAARRARRLRRAGHGARAPRRARVLRRRARRNSLRAQRLARLARRCRARAGRRVK